MEPEEQTIATSAAPAPMTQQEWLNTWKARLAKLLEDGKDNLVTELNEAAENGVPHRHLEPSGYIDKDIECAAIEESPLPYVLNAGAGFFPTAAGFRTRKGRPVTVVGVDPLAYAINEALGVMGGAHPDVAKSRRFVAAATMEDSGALFPPGTFHAVWSDGALLDCFDPVRFLQACVRATKQAGVVFVRLGKESDDRLWKVLGHKGSKLALASARGAVEISEIRGERIEVHTLLDGTLAIKIRRAAHSQAEAEKMLAKATSGLVLPGRQ